MPLSFPGSKGNVLRYSPGEALRRYMDFVADGRNQPGPCEKLKKQIFLGSDEFVTSLQCTLGADASHQKIPAPQRRPPPKPLTQIAEAHGRDEEIFDTLPAVVTA